MALLKCPDCGHDVSSLAHSCVNCGRPMGASDPPEMCEVILRRISGLGLFSGAPPTAENRPIRRNRVAIRMKSSLLTLRDRVPTSLSRSSSIDRDEWNGRVRCGLEEVRRLMMDGRGALMNRRSR